MRFNWPIDFCCQDWSTQLRSGIVTITVRVMRRKTALQVVVVVVVVVVAAVAAAVVAVAAVVVVVVVESKTAISPLVGMITA